MIIPQDDFSGVKKTKQSEKKVDFQVSVPGILTSSYSIL